MQVVLWFCGFVAAGCWLLDGSDFNTHIHTHTQRADLLVTVMTATVAFCSSIHTAAIPAVAKDLHCSIIISTLGVSTFLLGFAVGPLIYAPLSEIYGRNPIYRITFLLFVLFNLGCALSPNIAALLVFRFFCGFFGSPTGKSSPPPPPPLDKRV